MNDQSNIFPSTVIEVNKTAKEKNNHIPIIIIISQHKSFLNVLFLTDKVFPNYTLFYVELHSTEAEA